MTALRLTAYDTGTRSPAELFPAETRRNIVRRDAKPPTRGPSEEERRIRMVLALEVREMFDSTAEMARAVGVYDGSIKQWLCGSRPVPDKYLAVLKRIAGGGK